MLKKEIILKKIVDLFFEDSINMLVGVNEGYFCILRWCVLFFVFVVDCEVGRGVDFCWKSVGRGVRESISYFVFRGLGYVLYFNVLGYMLDILFIWKIKLYDNLDILCIIKGKKFKD